MGQVRSATRLWNIALRESPDKIGDYCKEPKRKALKGSTENAPGHRLINIQVGVTQHSENSTDNTK